MEALQTCPEMKVYAKPHSCNPNLSAQVCVIRVRDSNVPPVANRSYPRHFQSMSTDTSCLRIASVVTTFEAIVLYVRLEMVSIP